HIPLLIKALRVMDPIEMEMEGEIGNKMAAADMDMVQDLINMVDGIIHQIEVVVAEEEVVVVVDMDRQVDRGMDHRTEVVPPTINNTMYPSNR
ncbi:hypothetical protein BGW38_007813, partial [Lunasporangiospora selenospora]